MLTKCVTSPVRSRMGDSEISFQMGPYRETLAQNSQTKIGLTQVVLDEAYRLWEQDGRPERRTEEYWHRALDQHLRERAYVLWQQEGSPESRADEYWRRIVDFKAY